MKQRHSDIQAKLTKVEADKKDDIANATRFLNAENTALKGISVFWERKISQMHKFSTDFSAEKST